MHVCAGIQKRAHLRSLIHPPQQLNHLTILILNDAQPMATVEQQSAPTARHNFIRREQARWHWRQFHK